MRAIRLLTGGGAFVLAVAASLTATGLLTTPAPVTPDGPDPSKSAPPLAFSKLDGPSRALADSLTPGEVVTARLFARGDEQVAEIAKRGRNAGLDVQPSGGEEPQVTVTGEHAAILELATLAIVGSVRLQEDVRAMRLIAAPLEQGWSMPIAGLPYADAGLPLNSGAIAVPPDQRAMLLGSLASLVETIDGQPYAGLAITGACSDDPVTDCWVYLEGANVKGSERLDRWPVHASVQTGWFVGFDRGDPPTFRAVPRWLGREAERIARTDGPALEQIRGYEWLDFIGWNPTLPGVIEVGYRRTCGGGLGNAHVASLDRGPVAEDGGCDEFLTVAVDVAEGRVVAIR